MYLNPIEQDKSELEISKMHKLVSSGNPDVLLLTLSGLEEGQTVFGDPECSEDVDLNLALNLVPGLPIKLSANADTGVVDQGIQTCKQRVRKENRLIQVSVLIKVKEFHHIHELKSVSANSISIRTTFQHANM